MSTDIVVGSAGGSGGGRGGGVCYRKGTRILTSRGEVAIEHLTIGDLVVAADGRVVPTRWIGWRRFDRLTGQRRNRLAPVRIMADALADGVPRRDLFVSPDHSLWLGDMLIPACLLANGATIAQEQDVEEVEYFHVECVRPTILLAEGAPAESYVDAGNRGFFANAPGPVTFDPDLQAQIWRAALAKPQMRNRIEEKRRRLMARAGKLGFRKTDDPNLVFEADGAALVPQRVSATQVQFSLPANVGSICILSRSAVPNPRLRKLEKTRRIGIGFVRLELIGRGLRHVIAAEDPQLLQSGFHDAERDGANVWRWTDGAARLPYRPLPYAMQATLHHLPHRPEYWQPPERCEATMIRASSLR